MYSFYCLCLPVMVITFISVPFFSLSYISYRLTQVSTWPGSFLRTLKLPILFTCLIVYITTNTNFFLIYDGVFLVYILLFVSHSNSNAWLFIRKNKSQTHRHTVCSCTSSKTNKLWWKLWWQVTRWNALNLWIYIHTYNIL